MADSKDNEIPLKVVIDRKTKEVVFAEANSDFVDILFSFLTLTMGTIIRLLAKHSADSSCPGPDIGSFNNLYRSVSDLEAMYFETQECQDMLLNTRNSAEAECRKLKINIDDIKRTEYFICPDLYCQIVGKTHVGKLHTYLSTYNTTKCKRCRKVMDKPIELHFSSNKDIQVFTTKTASFVISNDLHVFPNNPSSTFGILESIGITDFAVLEENTLKFGNAELLDLLQYSLLSKTPLTNMFYGKKCIRSPVPTTQSRISTEGEEGLKKMTVKIFVQKSNNKILMAHSSQDFIDFLFSFLTIPLGRVISLLSKDFPTALSIENIYKTVSGLNVGEDLKSNELKDMLPDPQLPMHYLCFNQIFPLKEATREFFCNDPAPVFRDKKIKLKLQSPKGEAGFVRGQTNFMVTDNLVVTPSSSFLCIKYLQRLKVPPTDIEEQVINIGMEEGLNLLRASLTSESVLTSGLEYYIQKKPKQENIPERLMKKPKVEK